MQNCGLYWSGWPQSKTERNLTGELKKKTVEHESDVYTNCNWYSWYSHRRIFKGTGGLGNKRTSGNHPNYYIIEINQNTEKSPGDWRMLAVTQTSVKEHPLTLTWKTLKEQIIIILSVWPLFLNVLGVTLNCIRWWGFLVGWLVGFFV